MSYHINKFHEESIFSIFITKLLKINWIIVFCVILLCAIGVASLYSAAGGDWNPWAKSHFLRSLFGIFLMFFIALLPPKLFYKLSVPSFLFGLLSLFFVKFFGVGDVQRWISIGGFNFQPSEPMKLVLILMLAKYFDNISKMQLNQIFPYIFPIICICLPGFIVMSQPDLGTGLTIIILGMAILFYVGISLKVVFFFLLALISFVPIIWQQLYDYQKNRILVFLNPQLDSLGSGYQIIQSKIAIGSGGFFGKGFLNGSQSYLDFLPEKHTDFIFTLFSEEFGFFGSIFILLLYVLIVHRIIKIGHITRNNFGKLYCYGFATAFFVYVAVNMGMVLGLLPIVGAPLPIMSYGGSSMLAIMFGLSIVMSCKIYKDVPVN